MYMRLGRLSQACTMEGDASRPSFTPAWYRFRRRKAAERSTVVETDLIQLMWKGTTMPNRGTSTDSWSRSTRMWLWSPPGGYLLGLHEETKTNTNTTQCVVEGKKRGTQPTTRICIPACPTTHVRSVCFDGCRFFLLLHFRRCTACLTEQLQRLLLLSQAQHLLHFCSLFGLILRHGTFVVLFHGLQTRRSKPLWPPTNTHAHTHAHIQPTTREVFDGRRIKEQTKKAPPCRNKSNGRETCLRTEFGLRWGDSGVSLASSSSSSEPDPSSSLPVEISHETRSNVLLAFSVSTSALSRPTAT